MAKPAADDRSSLLGEPPAEVQITIIPGPRGRTLREQLAHARVLKWLAGVRVPLGRRVIGAGVIAAAVVGALVLALALGGRGRAVSHASARSRGGSVAVAPAAQYPVRCLSVAIALHDPRFARAGFDQTVPCGRHHGHVVASRSRPAVPWLSTVDADELAG
jgi:hypothetical protein